MNDAQCRHPVALTLSARYARRRCESGTGHNFTTRRENGMTTFDKREEGFEKKFAHDEELKFKAYARRNKLLGLWAAAELGKTGADADLYAKEVVLADFEEAGDGDVIRKVVTDLKSKGITEDDVIAKLSELLALAVTQIQAGK
jgi:hypothetical protein